MRRGLLTAALATPAVAAQPWPRVAPDQAGFAPDLAERLDHGIRSGLLRGLHGVLLAREGRILLERYDDGPDEEWGRPLGQVAMGPETLHDLRSVTKSVVGLLYGIALARGQVPPPEAPLYAQFPEYPDLAADPARAGMRVEHALSMTMGLRWDESVPYLDARNSEIAMEQAPDRRRYVLEQPMVTPPGARWTYSGGATALLGRLITRGSGQTLPDYAREVLFGPLGITRFAWQGRDPGEESAASGLRLTLRDLARIGELVRQGGVAEGRQLVPAEWIAASTRPVIATGDGLQYGRHWFLGRDAPGAGPPQPWIGGFGNGGQRLWVMPAAGLTLAIFAGRYNAPDGWISPTRVWREIVLPNLRP
ncbi:serine hydrolase [Roseomonas frigidaquae]|uniref:Serine hydrolase n=2 Tax=Falsiroseomonas frigidaquae TaxID=487318 RepID=A0ABX1EWS0_9PROT|nr:serine hydrolase [Falsiroseomonas frigidaquae]